MFQVFTYSHNALQHFRLNLIIALNFKVHQKTFTPEWLSLSISDINKYTPKATLTYLWYSYMTNIRPYLDHTPELGARVFIDPSALVIGDVNIGADSSIWPMVTIRGDMHHIRIGERTSIQDGSVLHITHAGPYNPDGFPLEIGSDVTVGHKALLHGCTISDRVLVGMGAIVMDGVTIEEDVILAAGSIVPPGKVLKSGFLYRGSPAKQARPLSDKERSFFSYTAGNYVKLKDQHISDHIQQGLTC